MPIVAAPGLDLTDPDLIADHLPAEEFTFLRRNDPVYWNAQDPAISGCADGGFWAITRHADVTAVSADRAGWSVEQNSAFVRLLSEHLRGGQGGQQEPAAVHGSSPPHAGARRREPVLHAAGSGSARG